MGAVLEPTTAMTPWYAVEVRRESAYVTAAMFIEGHLRQYVDEGDMTEDERAAAWFAVGKTTTAAPGTPAALAAALTQITDHPSYGRWLANGGQPAAQAGAELRDGRLLITAPHAHRYAEDKRADGSLGTVEFGYEDVAALLDALAALV